MRRGPFSCPRGFIFRVLRAGFSVSRKEIFAEVETRGMKLVVAIHAEHRLRISRYVLARSTSENASGYTVAPLK